MKKQIVTKNAPAAIGPYSQGIEIDGTVYVSGQLGLVPETGEFAEGGIEGQARQALRNVRAILEAAGLTMGDVVKTTCLLQDIRDFGAFNEVYKEFFEGVVPARSAYAVAGIPKGGLVEIEVVGVK